MPDNDNVSPEPWSDLEAKFELQDVRIVATLEHDGGAIVELLPRLECIEGRRYTSTGHGPDYEPTYLLEYHFTFGVPEIPPPLAAQQADAHIVITGNHTNGKRIEIRGNGFIGYDNDANVEGLFEEPPVMLTVQTDFPHSDDDDDDDDMTEEEFLEHINTDYPMPQQFEDACVRVPAPD